ncbi:MAG: hypothetical protein LBE14_01830 [Treponema sp.]|jgi:flagellar hook protein FlgE|nr:hypothetical protein [Treponema sp.]
MKKLPLIALIPVLTLFVVSCEGGFGSQEELESAPSARFYVYDNTEPYGEENVKNYYEITAYQRAVRNKCEIWVEKGANVSEAEARQIAGEYDTKIYPVINGAFGFTVEFDDGAIEALDYGDVDGNGRLLILLLDIRDGYKNPNDSYVAGYFGGNDLYSREFFPYSNETDMIYLDINPGKKGTQQFYATIAHEMQHLIHSLANLAIRSDENTYREQELWIDEGLSSAAEYLYLGNHTATGRVSWFNADRDGTIAKGNNFFVWDNGLDEYATVYLFFQWLRIQAGGNQIYQDIITSGDIGYQAVSGPAGNRFDDDTYKNWETLLRAWFAANYINASAGPYGYKGEISPQIHTIPSRTTSILLKPGEGVYSKLNGSNSFSDSGNIKYSELEKAKADKMLLTFNKNSSTGGKAESGQTTGIAASIQPGDVTASRAAADSAPQGPYPIGVRDYLGGRQPGPGVPQVPDRGKLSGARAYVKP